MRRTFLGLISVAFKNMFVWALAALMSVTGLFAALPQPVYAATDSTQNSAQTEEVISPNSETFSSREAAYEEAVKAVNNPQMGVEKEFEKDLKVYREENPDKGGLVEKAKEAVEKVTGNTDAQ